jgi:pimeloyl-ACP methyl ester carboxylesterase
MPRTRTLIRGATAVALLAGAGALAWDRQRRADARAVEADPANAELSRELHGRTVPVVSADGTRIHAEIFGPDDAPTVVLVHGWTCRIAVWHYQIRDLRDEFRVVAYDQRGHGRSQAPAAGGYTAQALADDLHAVIEACVPQGEQCLVAGHSMGGMTIVSWAGTRPEHVRSHLAAAALISTGMGDLTRQTLILNPPWASRLHDALAPRIAGLTLPVPQRSTPLSHRAVRYIALSRSASPATVAFTERMVSETPAPARGGFGRIFHELDLYDSLAHLGVPTTVIVGENDRLTPSWHARRMAELLPDVVDVVEIPEIGHMAPLEAPAQVTQVLRDLARRHLPARRAVAG